MAPVDEPQVGQIVDHYFLWADEQAAGRIEGRKVRPCLIIAVSQAPRAGTTAVAVPDDVKARIGLARALPAWVVVDDANVFGWPGYDLVPQPGGGFVRGVVTRGFFRLVRNAVLAAHARGRPRKVERDE